MKQNRTARLQMQNGSRVAVMGGGPAGSFFTYFLLDMARRAGLDIEVDIYEPRNFAISGPAGCNMCGGIVSEALVQTLAAEGISLPPSVVQRGIDSYTLHMDVGSVRIDTPLREKRIAAVHRGSGPRGTAEIKWESFDAYLQSLALQRGAHLVPQRIDSVKMADGRPCISTTTEKDKSYDLVAVTVGVNTAVLKLFEPFGYVPPRTTKALIREYFMGEEALTRHLGSSMHVFLLDLPRLQFGALIPKGDYMTACLLGEDVDGTVAQSFFDSPEVRACLPPGWRPEELACHCSPRINVAGARQPFGDRLVFIGDCAVTRLYKDGIGAAYRSAKAAATTAVFQGISTEDWKRHYLPACKSVEADNRIGKLIFAIVREQQKRRHDRLGILKMVTEEQARPPRARRMSAVLWDMFTGSAPYREVFLLAIHPLFLLGLAWSVLTANARWTRPPAPIEEEDMFRKSSLGRVYHDGEAIVRQGESGDCMYLIQEGEFEVWHENGGPPVLIRRGGKGEFIGEMAIFNGEVRSATVRARGEVQALTIDRSTLLRRIHEDPSLAYRMLQQLSSRVRDVSSQLSKAKEGKTVD